MSRPRSPEAVRVTTEGALAYVTINWPAPETDSRARGASALYTYPQCFTFPCRRAPPAELTYTVEWDPHNSARMPLLNDHP